MYWQQHACQSQSDLLIFPRPLKDHVKYDGRAWNANEKTGPGKNFFCFVHLYERDIWSDRKCFQIVIQSTAAERLFVQRVF